MTKGFFSDRAHSARFVWDDGHGETRCSARYLELRHLHHVALGRAAEARLAHDEVLALQFDTKARAVAKELAGLRAAGHVGSSTRHEASEFSAAFQAAHLENLRLC